MLPHTMDLNWLHQSLFIYSFILFIIMFIYLLLGAGGTCHSEFVVVRRHLAGLCSLIPPCGFQGLNSDHLPRGKCLYPVSHLDVGIQIHQTQETFIILSLCPSQKCPLRHDLQFQSHATILAPTHNRKIEDKEREAWLIPSTVAFMTHTKEFVL